MSLWIYIGIFVVGVLVIGLVANHNARRLRRKIVSMVSGQPQRADPPAGPGPIAPGVPLIGDPQPPQPDSQHLPPPPAG